MCVLGLEEYSSKCSARELLASKGFGGRVGWSYDTICI